MKHLPVKDSQQTRIRKTLARIADAVGRPVAAFVDTSRDDVSADDAAELLRLWTAIEDPEARRQALAFVRSLAEARPREPGAAPGEIRGR